jgi:rod shape-determining protein MreB
MVDTVIKFVRKKRGLIIAELTAERVLRQLASGETVLRIRGRDAASGLPNTVTVTSAELRAALRMQDR